MELARRMQRVFQRWSQRAVNLLLPAQCVCCGGERAQETDRTLFCQACAERLAPAGPRFCLHCGSTVPPDHVIPDSCPWCRVHRFRCDRVVPLGIYEGELRQAVLRAKRSRGELIARALARLFVRCRGDAVKKLGTTLVVPVPMFWLRRVVRGTNSPEVFAEVLADHLQQPTRRVVWRVRNTLPQADLSPSERFQNMRSAFALRGGYPLQGTHVLLVDDILTTGATCNAIAMNLRRGGAKTVSVAVWARAGSE